MIPEDLILAASSAMLASFIVFRGWWGLGRIDLMGMSNGSPAGDGAAAEE
jgi:hypothetical protein